MSNDKEGPSYLDDELLSKLAEIRELSLSRATSLRTHANPRTQADSLWMSLALQELDVAHEELRVVEEELHSQAEALNTAYSTLEVERQRYRELFESAPAAYLVTDADGVVVEANRCASQLLGIPGRFLVGKPLATFIGEEDRGWIRNLLALLTSSGQPSTFDLHVRPRKSANAVWTRASVQCAREAGAATMRWILHEARERPVRGQERTASPTDAAREQLERELAVERESREGAERALQRGNDVLAFVAHELRNPLSTTAGWLEILRREDIAVPSREHVLGVLTRNVNTLSRLVEELVDQTRIVQDEIKLECEPTDLRSLLERVCEDARGVAQTKHQRFDSELEGALGSMQADPFRLQQALNNILANALKFTPERGVVQFRAHVIGNELQCAIRDGGPGIAKEHLRTIFEPFVRVNARGEHAGLGLGLNIARRLIELHGGSVRAESDGLGYGATFYVRLPLTARP
ncbi:MAG TPA: PAS domain-containing sensor histidine kinase [Polyangiales bacterium]|nr:PAS domain-containing sensor histidine kinase [Polyangiales bacterium]